MILPAGPPDPRLTMEDAMKVGLLGTGFGIAHAHIYHAHPEVSEVVVFGRTPAKLQAFAEQFGYATTTEVASIYDDPAIDLVDVCLPTGLHGEHVLRALQAGKHVLCELPLAATMDDAGRIIDAAAASDRQVFVDIFGRLDPATRARSSAAAPRRCCPSPMGCAAATGRCSPRGPSRVAGPLAMTAAPPPR